MTATNPAYQDSERPANVGILAMEMYIPRRKCVSEIDLEVYDGVLQGKYTIGLGQDYMAFTDDREDINSFALSGNSLLRKYHVDPRSIGRLEVGTETLIDKSKSVKTTLMDLFAGSGNFDIEGVDSKNACYGSTAALFNAINWIESRSWDGRNAIVFAGDIAVYDKGNARAVGGAGACAMLIGPDAPIVLEPLHATYMANEYDFYKPRLISEYPVVDGQGSINVYLEALDSCYTRFQEKSLSRYAPPSSATYQSKVDLESFDYHIFHSPYGKLVQKGYARLLYHDYRSNPNKPLFENIRKLGISAEAPIEAPQANKALEKALINVAKPGYEMSVAPSMACAKRCGNLYTGSLYGGLASLLSRVPPEQLVGKRVLMFAFGGGAAASMYAIRIRQSPVMIAEKMDLLRRLESMRVASVEEYIAAMEIRERNQGRADYVPSGLTENLFDGAYYLERIDDKFRRHYAQRPVS